MELSKLEEQKQSPYTMHGPVELVTVIGASGGGAIGDGGIGEGEGSDGEGGCEGGCNGEGGENGGVIATCHITADAASHAPMKRTHRPG